MDQGTVKYQVWTPGLRKWVDISNCTYKRWLLEGCQKVRKSEDGKLWTEPGPPYRIDGDLTT
jgi:hypothetical protein